MNSVFIGLSIVYWKYRKAWLHSGLVTLMRERERERGEEGVGGWMHGWMDGEGKKNVLCNQDYKTVSS